MGNGMEILSLEQIADGGGNLERFEIVLDGTNA
jgi:hypothetical protein